MNAFNRLVMIIIALLMIAVPVLLLLVAFGVLAANLVTAATGPTLDALGTLSVFSFDAGARLVTGIVGILIALVAGYLALKEVPLGKRIDRRAYVNDTPGQEIAVTAQAVRRLVEGAAREVGAASPRCYLASERRRYDVSCDIRVPESEDFSELATRARGNIRRVLEEQQVPVNDVEVTVQGTVAQG